MEVADADIDHFYASAAATSDMRQDAVWRAAGLDAASPDEYLFIAMGALSPDVNRGVQARTDLDALLRKALDLPSIGETEKKVIARGAFDHPAIADRLMKTGFMVPAGLVRMNNVERVTRDTLKGGRETELFGGLFGL